VSQLELPEDTVTDLQEITKEENRRNPEDEVEPVDALRTLIDRYWDEQ